LEISSQKPFAFNAANRTHKSHPNSACCIRCLKRNGHRL